MKPVAPGVDPLLEEPRKALPLSRSAASGSRGRVDGAEYSHARDARHAVLGRPAFYRAKAFFNNRAHRLNISSVPRCGGAVIRRRDADRSCAESNTWGALNAFPRRIMCLRLFRALLCQKNVSFVGQSDFGGIGIVTLLNNRPCKLHPSDPRRSPPEFDSYGRKSMISLTWSLKRAPTTG